MKIERKSTITEFKFVSGPDRGEFEGYGSVFGNIDSYGDVVERGAFHKSLLAHKAAGTMPGMFAEHSLYMPGGDPLPIGKWTDISEDETGLYCKGKLVALDTDYGKRLYALMKEDVLSGLSIAFGVQTNGAVYGDEEGNVRRRLTSVDLYSVDVVRDPANAEARVASMKAFAEASPEGIKHLRAAIDLCAAEERDEDVCALLQNAHKELTGDFHKSSPKTIRDAEKAMRDAGFTRAEARAIAEHGFKVNARESGPEAKQAAEVERIMRGLRGNL